MSSGHASGRERVRQAVAARRLVQTAREAELSAPAVETAFDVAFWFCDTALNENEYLQPQKMQRLLYLAHAYFGIVSGGRKLMPSVFVATEAGPIEPNIYRAFANGRPNMEANIFLEEEVEYLLESVWRRFGHHAPERLTKLTKDNAAYMQAFNRGEGTEIGLSAMILSFSVDREAPAPKQVVKPKVMVSQTGRPVTVQAWAPPVKAPGK